MGIKTLFSILFPFLSPEGKIPISKMRSLVHNLFNSKAQRNGIMMKNSRKLWKETSISERNSANDSGRYKRCMMSTSSSALSLKMFAWSFDFSWSLYDPWLTTFWSSEDVCLEPGIVPSTCLLSLVMCSSNRWRISGWELATHLPRFYLHSPSIWI